MITMPTLTAPTPTVRVSFLAAMADFAAEGRGPHDNTMIGREIGTWADSWADPTTFERYVAALRADALEDTPRPAGHVPATTLWWVEGDAYLGRLAIRHRLNESLLERGGHIGYDVPPSARRRGHATAMLRAALPIAAGLGIDKALVCCDEGNVASRKVIETCGGVFEDQRGPMRRYWVPTAP